MDPAVLGTLRIGLDALDSEVHPRAHRRSPNRSRTSRTPLRVALAVLLRRAAEHVEPRRVGEPAPEV
jgi:hypothetical protein